MQPNEICLMIDDNVVDESKTVWQSSAGFTGVVIARNTQRANASTTTTTTTMTMPALSFNGARSPIAKLLLVISHAMTQRLLTPAQRSALKDRALVGDSTLLACIEAFEVDGDLDELLDSMRMLC